MERIDSINNKFIKNINKLEQKKYREKTGTYLIEGFHLVEEALKAKRKYTFILATENALMQAVASLGLDPNDNRIVLISQKIAEHLSATKSPQGIFMVLKISQPKNFSFNYGKWVMLDHLADPGNVGTIIRTADAAGFTGVILSPRSVDLYNSKVQRAMQGSQFHLDLVVSDLYDAVADFKASGIPVYASMLDPRAKELAAFVPAPQVAIIIGNEAHGVEAKLAELADEKLYIPILGRAESLNAAVAAGIMIYHFA